MDISGKIKKSTYTRPELLNEMIKKEELKGPVSSERIDFLKSVIDEVNGQTPQTVEINNIGFIIYAWKDELIRTNDAQMIKKILSNGECSIEYFLATKEQKEWAKVVKDYYRILG